MKTRRQCVVLALELRNALNELLELPPGGARNPIVAADAAGNLELFADIKTTLDFKIFDLERARNDS